MLSKMVLDLDEVRLAEDSDHNGIGSLARRVLQILHLRDRPDEINVPHRFTHKTRHDTKTTNLDLELPVDDLVLERRDEDAAALVLDLRPADELRVLVM